MVHLQFSNLRSILCIGAHGDDIEIGCGGTLLKLLSEHRDVCVHWVVLSGKDERAEESKRSASRFLQHAAQAHVTVHEFRDAFFPYQGASIKELFFEIARQVQPDAILTHRREDLHQDHRLVSELTWNTFRNHLILEYEIPKYEGDLGTPNVFVPLCEELCTQKVNTIMDVFRTQHEKPWFSKETFWSLLRIRGLEACSPSHFAEALYCRKLVL